MPLLEYSNFILIQFFHWMGHSCFDYHTEVMFVLSSLCFIQSVCISLASNHRTDCWFVCPSYFDTKYLHPPPLCDDNLFSIFFPTHCTVSPSTNMFLQKGQQCITFSLSSFFPLLTPLIVYSFSHNVRSHHIQTFPLSSLRSLLFLFSLFPSSSLVFKTLTFFYSLLLFFLFSPWTDPSLFLCASLYVLSFDNPLEPLSPMKSRLKCSLPVSEGWGLLCSWYV